MKLRIGGRVVEGARLESVYTPQAYRGFESHPLRKIKYISIDNQYIIDAFLFWGKIWILQLIIPVFLKNLFSYSNFIIASP